MSVFVTGDTHGGFERFSARSFPARKALGRGDYMIICGDFGGVWDGEPQDAERLDWLEALPFTTLWVDGNHENFDELDARPAEEWHGGLVHRIRPHVLHLMRGQVFEIGGSSFFTMGGAQSTDLWDGLLDPEEPGFERKYWALRRQNAVFRVRHLSWWEQELPSPQEYDEARRNLARVRHAVDFIITHCAPDSIQALLGEGRYPRNALTGFLEEVSRRTEFRRWLFGHYHADAVLRDRYILLCRQIRQLL